MRVVEEIALDPPGLVIDLLPHPPRFNVDLPPIKFQRTKTGFGSTSAASTRRIIRRSCRPGLSLTVKNFLSIKGHREVVHILHDFVDLPLAQLELLNRLRHVGKIVFRKHHWPFSEE